MIFRLQNPGSRGDEPVFFMQSGRKRTGAGEVSDCFGRVSTYLKNFTYLKKLSFYSAAHKNTKVINTIFRLPPPRTHPTENLPARRPVCGGAAGKYGNAVLATTGGQERAGCPRAEKRDTTNRWSKTNTRFSKPRTPRPFLSECRSEHAFHISPAPPPHTGRRAGRFSSPYFKK